MMMLRVAHKVFRPGYELMKALLCLVLGMACTGPLSALDPVKFLPEVLSTDIRPHSRLEFSADGHELYWSGYVKAEDTTEYMFFTDLRGGAWSVPQKLPFNGGMGNGPALSPDGRRLYFGAQRKLEEDGPVYAGIWYVERIAEGWSEVNPVRVTLDTAGFAGRPSFSHNGNLYYLARGTRAELPSVFRCRLENGSFAEPELISGAFAGEIVMDPWIAPDESFLLFMADDWATSSPSYGSSDLYISYRQDDESWGEATNLGPRINTEHFDRSPSLSPDGEFLFFIRAVGDVFVESDAHFYRSRFVISPRQHIPVSDS